MKEVHVLNLGAGVQSTTLALLSIARVFPEKIPIFDCAIFADVGDEPAAVYSHLGWLMAKCAPFFPTIVRSKGRLGDDLILGIPRPGSEARMVSIPAFTTEIEGNTDESGMTKRQCTKEYKTEVIERAIRRDVLGLAPRKRIPRDVVVHQYLGLSYDEPGRIFGKNGRPGAKDRVEANPRFRAHFPLYDLFMTRAICRAWLAKQEIPHEVPRSACSFCPYHDNAEWLRMKTTDPESWNRAVEIDRAIRDHDSTCAKKHNEKLYLHRSCLPLEKVDLTLPDPVPRQQDLNFSVFDCEGMCGL